MLSPIRGWMKDWLNDKFRDGKFWLEQYLIPMAEQSVITVQALHGGVRMLRNRYLMMNVIVTTLVIRT